MDFDFEARAAYLAFIWSQTSRVQTAAEQIIFNVENLVSG